MANCESITGYNESADRDESGEEKASQDGAVVEVQRGRNIVVAGRLGLIGLVCFCQPGNCLYSNR
jgi:hypothetical protein